MLYNLCIDEKSKNVERVVINDKCKTFFSDWKQGVFYYDNVVEASVLHEKNNLPIIDTIFDATSSRKLLKKYVQLLGGFPIVLKLMNGSHGVGVVKVDTFDSLFSIADVFVKKDLFFIIRKYIDYKEHARMIVLGSEVISSIEYKRASNDFRSNIGKKPEVYEKKYSREMQELAVQATNILGFEFGGVDLLIDKDGSVYIAEVNFPCFFPRAQLKTGDDISGLMIDYLLNK